MVKMKVANGIFWVEIPEADLRILCGCPADSVKHLMKRGFITPKQTNGVSYVSGPNAILLSDVPVQKGLIANLAEFPVLQMLYMQGMIIPKHPNNTGQRPMLIGLEDQVRSQSEYIFRGNYGLASEEELTQAGVPAGQAREFMRIKRWFAFGRIRSTEELIDLKVMSQDVMELKPGVFVHRKGLNIYEFIHAGRSVEVDLNLADGEEYEAPYELASNGIRRDYFSVIHTGEGDGWDTTKPCMASIVCFQGRLFLIDAGPNIQHTLTALGISVNEIEGLFQTHAHDDHCAGLTTLSRSGKRIKYYAVPYVRAVIEKKLSSLMGLDSGILSRYFEMHDLEPGKWNQLDGLEVRPVFSPHPVETTILFFRAAWESGYKTYAHLADLSSMSVLQRMRVDDPAKDGISPETMDRFVEEMLTPVDIKKIDAGGGLIHGMAEDFQDDASGKIFISHLGTPLSDAQKEIGSSATFGMSDVLIPSQNRTYLLRSARLYLRTYFPHISDPDLDMFLNCDLVSFNPGAIILRKGIRNEDIYLILSGTAEFVDRSTGLRNQLSAGTMIGELAGFSGEAAKYAFRARSPIISLKIPCEMYRGFIDRSGLAEEIRRIHANRQFLFNTHLFGEAIPLHVQNIIAGRMESRLASIGKDIERSPQPGLCLLAEGSVALFAWGRLIETMKPGDFWGEGETVGELPAVFETSAVADSRYYFIPALPLQDIPIVLGKMLESFNRRIKSFQSKFRFDWLDFYAVGVKLIDDQHRRLFELIESVYQLAERDGDRKALELRAAELIEFTRQHFEQEEQLLEQQLYPELDAQRQEHAGLMNELSAFLKRKDGPSGAQAASEFFKNWLIRHTLLEDRKFKAYLAGRGVV